MKISRHDTLSLVLQTIGFREEKAGTWKAPSSFSIDNLIELQALLRDRDIQEMLDKEKALA